MNLVTEWFKRNMANPQVVLLLVVLLTGFVVVVAMGHMLMPVLASLVVAYLLEGLVVKLERMGLPRLLAVSFTVVLFLIFVTAFTFGLLPLLSRQVTDLIQQLPNMIGEGQKVLLALPERYPGILSIEQVEDIINAIGREIAGFGQQVLTLSLSSVVGVITLLLYLVLMPLLVFFFLKDKRLIITWMSRFLPEEHDFITDIWGEVDAQLANYVRGKFWEILIVWFASFITFSFLGLQYSMLLSVLVGLSVIIPYIGATVVTLPVLLVAWFQWGWGPDFGWLAVAYLVIQALDGNVLVPILFSGVVSLHPVAIIVAILVFGGIWGFWGVFFAIPLATLVNAILQAWPKKTAVAGP